MLNQVILVGRLTSDIDIDIVKGENRAKYTVITLAISRSYKNAEGEYDTDFVDCVLWNNIAENTAEYCKKGDIIGVKGRLQTKDINLQDDKKRKVLQVIAEKITLLSSYKN